MRKIFLTHLVVLQASDLFLISAAEPFKCKLNADIGFIVDASDDVRPAFTKQLSLIKGALSPFLLASNGAHAGVILAGNKVQIAVKLDEFEDSLSFMSAINQLMPSGGRMRIQQALSTALREFFSDVNGARQNVPHVLVILTSAKRIGDVDVDSLSRSSESLHAAGIRIILLAVGVGATTDHFSRIALTPQNILHLENFGELTTSTLQSVVGKQICKSSGMLISLGFLLKGAGSRNRKQTCYLYNLYCFPHVAIVFCTDFGGWDESNRKLLPKLHQYLCNRITYECFVCFSTKLKSPSSK